jgi:hypothetical protein
MYSRQCLGDGRAGGLSALARTTAAWRRAANERKQKIHGCFTK